LDQMTRYRAPQELGMEYPDLLVIWCGLDLSWVEPIDKLIIVMNPSAADTLSP
jgi:hypothetical protein